MHIWYVYRIIGGISRSAEIRCIRIRLHFILFQYFELSRFIWRALSEDFDGVPSKVDCRRYRAVSDHVKSFEDCLDGNLSRKVEASHHLPYTKVRQLKFRKSRKIVEKSDHNFYSKMLPRGQPPTPRFDEKFSGSEFSELST